LEVVEKVHRVASDVRVRVVEANGERLEAFFALMPGEREMGEDLQRHFSEGKGRQKVGSDLEIPITKDKAEAEGKREGKSKAKTNMDSLLVSGDIVGEGLVEELAKFGRVVLGPTSASQLMGEIEREFRSIATGKVLAEGRRGSRQGSALKRVYGMRRSVRGEGGGRNG
jgi:hypothetical protein